MRYSARVILSLFLITSFYFQSFTQRVYKASSVLASGKWYRIALAEEGIYKLDVSFLSSLGINISGLSSSSIRLFGNGGSMLDEACSSLPADDLTENPLYVSDGGDGILDGPDYCLFYAPGADRWVKDSLNKRFIHEKNIYSDSSFYYITIGGTGKRITVQSGNATPNVFVNSYNLRYVHEADLVNVLSGGKEWFGEEFADAPGKVLSRDFPINLPGLVNGSMVTLITDCMARSVNNTSVFDVMVNNQAVLQLTIPSTGAGTYDLFGTQTRETGQFNAQSTNVNIRYTFIPGSFNAQGWLNFFELHGRSGLAADPATPLFFRDWNSVGNNICEFTISNATTSTRVWEITDPLSPVLINGNFSQGNYAFVNDAYRLREYAAFGESSVKIPVRSGIVPNQDLHQLMETDYLVITHPSLVAQADKLAAFHRQHNNLRVTVATTEQVFNEFSSGSPDPTAIRDFVKMVFDKAQRNALEPPRYLLLFGDASFDYKSRINENTNLVPAYESRSSLDPLNTYTSDDFFGFLDDGDDINSGIVTNLLDIGIGRIPARNLEQTKNYVDKLLAYHQPASLGSWRNSICFIADDEDNNLHFNDAELITGNIMSLSHLPEIRKIYLDAYPQESGSGGSRYPEVNEAITNLILSGTLMLNYIGHGGASRLAEEAVIDQGSVNTWNNPDRLPLVITATCDFAPYDNPFINSLGENLLLRPQTGAIGLVTTTRPVFSFSNRIMNDNFMQRVVKMDTSGAYSSVGKVMMDAKNYTYQTSGDLTNNRKFTLLGDPALTPAFPTLGVRTTSINLVPLPSAPDTLSPGEKVIIEGEIVDNQSAIVTGFNGTIFPVVFDKPRVIFTRGNDPGSIPTPFSQYSDILFRGRATVEQGKFRFEFKMPKDINYLVAPGRISFYADNGELDAGGYFEDFLVGGSAVSADNDTEGPEIGAWLNDEKFVNGSITNQAPLLILKLSDSSGINTTGTGIGHDISFTIDQETSKVFILNDFYEAELDSYQSGMVRFQLPELEPGFHTLRIKAWDVLNNSTEKILEFQVVTDNELTVNHVLNYPNPFSTKTTFWFEHNKPGEELNVQIQILSVSGKLIKALEKTIITTGNRFCDIDWDGRDEYGNKVGRGVYLYRVKVWVRGSKPKYFIEKLVLL